MKKYAKKYGLISILTAFAISIIIWPLITRQSIHTTQEDPGTAQTSFSVSLSNILDYGEIASVLAEGGYSNVDELIDELDLDIADFPADIQFIIQTYNALLSDLTTKLSTLETTLDEADLLLSEGEFEKTSLKLTSADDLAEYIRASLIDMDNANEQIENILGSFTPTSQIELAEEVWAKLLEDTGRLGTLREIYEVSAPQNISTELNLEFPEHVYPGLPYKIHGQITYEAGTPSIERDITLRWDNERIDTVDSYQAQNAFDIELTPDDNTILGEHILTVIIEAQDDYGIASENKILTVTKVLPEIKIEALSYKVLSRKVQVSGKLDSKNPLEKAAVIIELKGTSTRVATSAEGEFEALLDLPFGLINIGKQEMKIRFEPSETWQSSTEITTEIFVLDMFSIGFISTAFITVGMIIYVAKRGRPGKGGTMILEMPSSPAPALEFTNTPLQKFKEEDLKGTRGQIVNAYIETTKMVENVTRVSMEPYMTLREFLRETTTKLNEAAEAFKELTRLAEDALYSPHMPDLDDTERAEGLALTVKEALKS